MPRSLSAQTSTAKTVQERSYGAGRNSETAEEAADVATTTGARSQRPRTSVRLPYRNLASQIVSQEEIAQEILQRSIRRVPGSEGREKKDVFFAMKLTQRLATRLQTSPPVKGEEDVDDPDPQREENGEEEHEPMLFDEPREARDAQTSVGNEVDPLFMDSFSSVPEPRAAQGDLKNTNALGDNPRRRLIPLRMDPALERELALKQLQELPSMKKPRRSRTDPGRAGLMLATKHASGPPPLPPGVAPSPLTAERRRQKNLAKSLAKKKPAALVEQSTQAGVSRIIPLEPKITAAQRKRKLQQAGQKPDEAQVAPKKTKTVATGAEKPKTPAKKPATLVNGTAPTSTKDAEDFWGTHDEIWLQTGGATQTASAEVTTEAQEGTRRRRSNMRELDMLLGDEGAVNMIYEAEHGQKKTAANSSSGGKKASKATSNRQELMLKAKLVKNAVLRLSSSPPAGTPSSTQAPATGRGRRTKGSPETSKPSTATVGVSTPQEPRSPPSQHYYPPHAEASRIIRRRSSDSDDSDGSRPPSPAPLTIIPGARPYGKRPRNRKFLA